jgi:hypothetical protein
MVEVQITSEQDVMNIILAHHRWFGQTAGLQEQLEKEIREFFLDLTYQESP